MNTIVLRVMNSLYKLEITDKEFESIEEEISHKERTGYFIACIKGDKLIAVNHDDKHSIIIGNTNRTDLKPKNRILLKTLINFEIPEQIYTLHSIVRYRALDLELRGTANNLEELKEKILDRLMDKYPKQLAGEIYQDEYIGFDEKKREKAKKKKAEMVKKQLEAIYWLFGEKFDFFNFIETRTNISQIVKIFEFKNRRLAIIQKNEKFEKCHSFFCRAYSTETCEGIKVSIQVFNPKDKRYDYADLGREIYENLWLCDEICGKITKSELEILGRRLGYNEEVIITNDIYEREKNAMRVEMMKARLKDEENENIDRLRENIKEKLKKGQKVIRNGIEITQKAITYNGVCLKGDLLEACINYNNIPLLQNPDFNNIYANYIEFLFTRGFSSNYSEEITNQRKFSIGKIKIVIDLYNKSFSINSKRVRQAELRQILLNALKYKTQEEYDDFLKDVSRESLRLKNALRNGIIFTLKVNKSEDNCLIQNMGSFRFTLKLEKSENKIYTRIKNKLFRIKDTSALFDLEKEVDEWHLKCSYVERIIKLLNKALENISPKEIGELIKFARKEDEKRIKRSKEFIDNAVRITKAERLGNGYIVKGKSGNEYFVGNDLKVYRMKNGKASDYICIVDYVSIKDDVQRNDFLAKRLLFLFNDTDVKEEIYTLFKEENRMEENQMEEMEIMI